MSVPAKRLFFVICPAVLRNTLDQKQELPAARKGRTKRCVDLGRLPLKIHILFGNLKEERRPPVPEPTNV